MKTEDSNKKSTRKERIFSKEEISQLSMHRTRIYDNSSPEEKLVLLLHSFQYSLDEYLNEEKPKKIVSVGEFIKRMLKELGIKQNKFASYIHIAPQNFNKFITGERRINIDLAMKLERIFSIEASTILGIQLKNEILSLKSGIAFEEYEQYQINDLLKIK